MSEKIVYMTKTEVVIACAKIVEKMNTLISNFLPISKRDHDTVKKLIDIFSDQQESLEEDKHLNFLYLELKDACSKVVVKNEINIDKELNYRH